MSVEDGGGGNQKEQIISCMNKTLIGVWGYHTVLWTLHMERERRRMYAAAAAWRERDAKSLFKSPLAVPKKAGRKEGYYVSGGAVLHAGWEDSGFLLLGRIA